MDGDGDIDSDDERLYAIQKSQHMKKQEVIQLKKDVEYWKNLYNQQKDLCTEQAATLKQYDGMTEKLANQDLQLKCLREMQAEITRQDKEILNLKARLDTCNTTVSELKDSLSKYQQKLQAQEKTAEALEKQLREQIIGLETTAEERAKKITELLVSVRKLESERDEMKENHDSEIQTKDQAYEDLSRELQAKIKSLETEIEELKAALAEAQSKIDQIVEDSKVKSRKSVADLQNAATKLQEAENEKEKQKQEKEQLIKEITGRKKELGDMMKKAKESLDNAPSHENLKDDYDRLIQKLRSLPQCAFNEMQGVMNSLEKDMEVWHDQQVEDQQNQNEENQHRSKVFDMIVQTLEKLQNQMTASSQQN